MGTLITTSIMIKLLLTSSLLALTAAAEADQQLPPLYDPVCQKLPTWLPTHLCHGYNGTYGKRSADDQPDPTPLIHDPPPFPALTYGTPYPGFLPAPAPAPAPAVYPSDWSRPLYKSLLT